MPLISVQNVTKTYPGRIPTPALKGVSFDIATGEFVAIMGRSGSGKSTLLHQLSLIDEPTSGTILIEGQNTEQLSDAEKSAYRLHKLGYVFQEYALIVELTAFENITLPAKVAGTDKNAYTQRAHELLALMGLQNQTHHYPNELSGGEMQRVAIARALINNPKILFADEPTANLDSTVAHMILSLFVKLKTELGQTIVMVTHEEDGRNYVDRVIDLRDGQIISDQMRASKPQPALQ
jgi:putative ABC transport system ATP-binding protein